MCTGGDPGGGSEENKTTAETPTKLEDRPKAKPKAKKTVATVKLKRAASRVHKGRYTGQGRHDKDYLIVLAAEGATGGLDDAVRAITGSDKAAPHMAGRADSIQELRGRLRVDKSLPGAAGAVLGGIGQASAARSRLLQETHLSLLLGDKLLVCDSCC